MWHLRSAVCRRVTCSHNCSRRTSSHHVRHNSLVGPRSDDDGVCLSSLDVTAPDRHLIQNGYLGLRTKYTTTTKELLRQLGLSIPYHAPSNPSSSKAYDPENAFPDRYVTPAARVGSEYYRAMQELQHIEAQALSIGREIARRSKDIYILRHTFRRLFEHCDTVHDVVRVLAIAFQKPSSTEALQHLAHPIVRALFRARAYARDKRIYMIYYTLITRLEKSGLRVDSIFYSSCAKFAARSRDPVAMQRALWLFRSRNVEMGFRTFRTIVAKFSIGINGYGEIRNGRWRREKLIPVILGFEGTNATGGEVEDHHLGSFLKRAQWGYLTAWVQILAHCRLTDELWHEWTLWRDGESRKQHNRKHRDEFFISQMLIAGDPRKAWMILNESRSDFWRLSVKVRTRLFDELENLDFITEAFADRGSFKKALLEKFEHDLDGIEEKLGVRWPSDGRGGGWHVVSGDVEERLESLSSEEFGRVYGYFADENQQAFGA